MIKFAEWKSATYDLPKEDGVYIVLRFAEDGRCYSAMDVNYTVEYGWNTTRLLDGTVNAKHHFKYAEDENAFWTTVKMENEE